MMRLPFILMVLIATNLLADEVPSGPADFDIIEDVVYGNKDGLGLTMDVLIPKQSPKGIGIVLVSSGGWRSAKSNNPAEEVFKRKNEHWVQGLLKGGYTLFVARHGSLPRYHVPEMIEDIRRSVRYVRHHANKYHVDPTKIGITSGSSGGHLSLMVGLTGDDGNPKSRDPIEKESSRVQAIVAWFPPTDLVNFGEANGYQKINAARPGFLQSIFREVTDIEQQLKSISPIEMISPDDPPVLLIHGDKDATVPLQQSEIFRDRYAAAGRPVKLIVHPGGGHTFWIGIMNDYPAVWDWFDSQMGPATK